MKATVSQLWDTHRMIITIKDSECGRPSSISELKKCENVLVGARICKGGPTEVLIDDCIYLAFPARVKHPSGGTMQVLEVD